MNDDLTSSLDRHALPDGAFAQPVNLAAHLLNVPLAALLLLDGQGAWLARQSAEDAPAELLTRFCAEVLNDAAPLVVPDAALDARFPAASGLFLAGAPLRAPGGRAIGALCVCGGAPRHLDAPAVQLLEDLAAVAQEEWNLRASNAGLRRRLAFTEDAAATLRELNRVHEAFLGVCALTDLGLDPADTAHRALELLSPVTDVDWSTLLAVHADRAEPIGTWLRPGLRVTARDLPSVLPRGTGHVWRVATGARAAYIDDYPSAADAVPDLARVGVRSGAWVPLGEHAGVRYVMAAARFRPGRWRERDRALLEAGARSVRHALTAHAKADPAEVSPAEAPIAGLGDGRALDAALRETPGSATVMTLVLDVAARPTGRVTVPEADLQRFAHALTLHLPPHTHAYRVEGGRLVVLCAGMHEPSPLLDALDDAMASMRGVGVALGLAVCPMDAADAPAALALAESRLQAQQRTRAAQATAPRSPRGAPPAPPEVQSSDVQFAGLHLMVQQRAMRLGDIRVALSAEECALLVVLAGRPERLHSRAELARLVWRQDRDVGEFLNALVRQLRAKLAQLTTRLSILSQGGNGFALHLLPEGGEGKGAARAGAVRP